MAAGMSLAGQADLILVDTEDKKQNIDALLSALGRNGKAQVMFFDKAMLNDRNMVIKAVQKDTSFDAVMDLVGINN